MHASKFSRNGLLLCNTPFADAALRKTRSPDIPMHWSPVLKMVINRTPIELDWVMGEVKSDDHRSFGVTLILNARI